MQRTFILGNPRSGTSLLRIMLNTHPKVAAPPECGFSQWWLEKYRSWNSEDALDIKRVEGFVRDILTSRKIETWRLSEEELVHWINIARPGNYGDLIECVYSLWAKNCGKIPTAIVDKNNYYIYHLDSLEEIWPDARFIFLIRDGRDVACSYRDVMKLDTDSPYRPVLSSNISEIAEEWQVNNSRIYQYLMRRPASKWIMVRYESLITRPEIELGRITSFLGLVFEKVMLQYYINNDEPSSTIDWKKKTLEKPDASNVGRFRTELAPADIASFNRAAAEMLRIGGYGN